MTKPPLAPKLAPPPRATTTAPPSVIVLHKPRGVSLGVKFLAVSHRDGGAEVESVEEYGIAWRAGLAWGDAVLRVRVYSQLRPGEVLNEHELNGGHTAAKALRPSSGRIELVVRRRRTNKRDAAQAVIASHWLGLATRRALRRALRTRAAAATTIAAHWRRCVCMWDLQDCRAFHRAATTIAAHWRRYGAVLSACERLLATQHIQQAVRAWLSRCGASRPRSPRGSRKRRRSPQIRRAPTLDEW